MKLPPLNAVRAFEAAARHGSMRDAAAELFVTPGAVSQQVRALESHLGIALFERSPRAIRLTAAGQEFHLAVSRHLRGIAQAAEQVAPGEQRIAVTVAPDFAARWLMPRLRSFAALNPKVEVRVDASFGFVDFEREAFDLGIRTAYEPPPSLHGEKLLAQTMRPFCSPGYYDAVFRGRSKAAVWAHARLLHENRAYDMWAPWFAMRGLSEPNAEVGLYFSHGTLAIIAAIEGEGVTLQPPEYVEREVASGALVAADAATLVSGLCYFLVWPKRPLRPVAEKFKAWVVGVARAEQAAPPPATTRVRRVR
jgi:LysR family glycine cleavage system transcriptional activator